MGFGRVRLMDERRKNQKEVRVAEGSYRRPETRIHSNEGSSQIHSNEGSSQIHFKK